MKCFAEVQDSHGNIYRIVHNNKSLPESIWVVCDTCLTIGGIYELDIIVENDLKYPLAKLI